MDRGPEEHDELDVEDSDIDKTEDEELVEYSMFLILCLFKSHFTELLLCRRAYYSWNYLERRDRSRTWNTQASQRTS